ncbi:hypothetical protein Trco_007358 [Trichoderma cornu-damae]|uniref:Uncharacterized protein n=1 Tax=Trichoderma cornu-damae TaxID=654480 RepID=A0A9P8QKB8_9HYPO|nr:hypothetical protein Trco_007358 [Trichoderma cornu-damae]
MAIDTLPPEALTGILLQVHASRGGKSGSLASCLPRLLEAFDRQALCETTRSLTMPASAWSLIPANLDTDDLANPLRDDAVPDDAVHLRHARIRLRTMRGAIVGT